MYSSPISFWLGRLFLTKTGANSPLALVLFGSGGRLVVSGGLGGIILNILVNSCTLVFTEGCFKFSCCFTGCSCTVLVAVVTVIPVFCTKTCLLESITSSSLFSIGLGLSSSCSLGCIFCCKYFVSFGWLLGISIFCFLLPLPLLVN